MLFCKDARSQLNYHQSFSYKLPLFQAEYRQEHSIPTVNSCFRATIASWKQLVAVSTARIVLGGVRPATHITSAVHAHTSGCCVLDGSHASGSPG